MGGISKAVSGAVKGTAALVTGGASMLGGGGSAPKSPNYGSLAQQDAEALRKSTLENTIANRPTQIAEGGKVSWTHDKDGNWVQTTALDQAGHDQFVGMQDLNAKNLAALKAQGAYVPPELRDYDANAGQMMADALYKSTMDRTRPEQEHDMSMFTTKLRQQGLEPGTAAFDRAMKNLMTSQGDVSAQASLAAKMAGGKEARDEYATYLAGQNQRYSQYDNTYGKPYDMMGASQGLQGGIYQPQFQGFNGATGYTPANMTNAANATYQNKMGNYNSQQQKKGGLVNTGITAAATVL